MAGYDRDEVPMLPDTHPTLVDESLDSQSQAYMSGIRSLSISSPTSSMELDEIGNNLVGSTGPLRSARRAPLDLGDRNPGDKVDKFSVIWKKIFMICCLVAIFLDPLFFLLLSVQQDNKCIAIHRNMTKTIVAFRSLTDFVFLLNKLLKFWHMESRDGHPRRTTQNYLNDLVDLFVVLPLPQIVILVLPKYLGSSGADLAKNHIIVAVLIQYAPRFILLVGPILEATWAIYFINLLIFVLSGHIIGLCWYLFGLQRVQQCLRDACYDAGFEYTQCLGFIDCGDKNARKNRTETNPIWESWKNNKNATACFSEDSFPYGIYKPVVHLTSKDITTRYVYSLFWGFQQISTLAGNQQPNDYVLEVLFTLLITLLGLLLLAFVIGNMQNFLQALDQRKLEFSVKQRDVKQWMSRRRLPEKLKKRVRAAERYNWATTKGVNEGKLIKNLPEDLQRDIRRHLFEFVKRVSSFASMDQHILDAIYERLKQTIYIKGSEILYPGGVVDKMVFIVRGKLESIGDDRTVTPLCEGSLCGEELLIWFHEHASVNKDGKKMKVTSTRRVKCLTDVEACSLGAADLEEFTDHFASFKKTENFHI